MTAEDFALLPGIITNPDKVSEITTLKNSSSDLVYSDSKEKKIIFEKTINEKLYYYCEVIYNPNDKRIEINSFYPHDKDKRTTPPTTPETRGSMPTPKEASPELTSETGTGSELHSLSDGATINSTTENSKTNNIFEKFTNYLEEYSTKLLPHQIKIFEEKKQNLQKEIERAA